MCAISTVHMYRWRHHTSDRFARLLLVVYLLQLLSVVVYFYSELAEFLCGLLALIPLDLLCWMFARTMDAVAAADIEYSSTTGTSYSNHTHTPSFASANILLQVHLVLLLFYYNSLYYFLFLYYMYFLNLLLISSTPLVNRFLFPKPP